MQPKKEFAFVDYEICNAKKCNPDACICAAMKACLHKVIKQIDGVFEPPIVFQDTCMGCCDCVEACRLDAIQMKQINLRPSTNGLFTQYQRYAQIITLGISNICSAKR